MTTQTLQKLNLLDLTDGNSVRSLFQELIQLIDNQKDEITKLRTDYDELKNEKDELGKRITKMERYSSYMCLTFHGIRDGGEYPVHKIVEIIRSVHIPIEPCDIAACHYLPGDGRNKPIIVKFLYNHQRDKVWEQRNSFFDPQTKSIIYVNERLAENDRDVYNYCRKEQDGNVPSRRHILGSKIFKEQLLEKFGKNFFFKKKILIFFSKKSIF